MWPNPHGNCTHAPLRPCIPNIRVPSKRVAIRITLECIRRELVLYKMLAHGFKRHVESPIVGCPSTFHVTWPAIWHVVEFQCLLLDLDGCATDWNFQFDRESEIGPWCSRHQASKGLFQPSARLPANHGWEILPGICPWDALEYHRAFRLVLLLGTTANQPSR